MCGDGGGFVKFAFYCILCSNQGSSIREGRMEKKALINPMAGIGVAPTNGDTKVKVDLSERPMINPMIVLPADTYHPKSFRSLMLRLVKR